MTVALTPVLAKLVRREDLDAAEIDVAMDHILGGDASDLEIAGFIIALRTKGESDDELIGLVRALLRHSVAIAVAPGAIDTCGTGGDRSGTLNVSTLAALVAAGAGARVVKHGNRAQSSQCGSADVLEALGIPIELGPAGVARCVEEAGIGFAFAPRYHPALRFIGPVRRALAVPTTFNFLGPLANPARVTRQCVGVSDGAMAERVLRVLVANGAERRVRVLRRRRPRRAHDHDHFARVRVRGRRRPELHLRPRRLRHPTLRSRGARWWRRGHQRGDRATGPRRRSRARTRHRSAQRVGRDRRGRHRVDGAHHARGGPARQSIPVAPPRCSNVGARSRPTPRPTRRPPDACAPVP